MKEALVMFLGLTYTLSLILIVLGLTVVPWALGISELVGLVLG